MLIDLMLPPRLEAVREARRALGALPPPASRSAALDLELLVSELVTNCVRHARLGESDAIGLSVTAAGRRLRVEVSDPGPGFAPGPGPVSTTASGGRGLRIVGRISHRWGVRVDGRTRVWFEVDWAPVPARAIRGPRGAAGLRAAPARRERGQAKGVVTGPSRSRSRS